MRNTLAFLLIISTGIMMAQQMHRDQVEHFDFKKLEASIRIFPSVRQVEGRVIYNFEVLDPEDTLFIDGKKMQFDEVLLNGEPAHFYSDEKGIYIINEFQVSGNQELSFNYRVQPAAGMYFINWNEEAPPGSQKQVWTQGQGKYTSTWLPSFDDMTEKLEFDLSFEFPSPYQVISNGRLENMEQPTDSTRQWHFDMEQPMSSYLVGFAAGNFKYKTIDSSTGDEIQLYYLPEDSLLVEPTYRYSAEIMDFLEKEIGVPYPWQNYKQVPVMDFLHGGMENTGATIFSASYLTDSIGFKDRNYVNVNAHEMAHQWFGNLITETRGKHHWLHEGFATYYALLAEKEIFGEDYYYWKLFQTAESLKELSDSGKGESLLNPGASSLTFYQKGAWALHILRERVGDSAFKEAVKNYLERYSFKNVVTTDFINEVEAASGMDLSQFVKDWLEQSAFKAHQSLSSLKNSEFIVDYLNIAALRETPLEQKSRILEEALDFPVNDYTGQEVVNQLSGQATGIATGLYKKAFQTNNIFVRQTIARTMQDIPASLKREFETLLEDESYLTREAALFKLWEQFPEDRGKYLDLTRDVDGFYNKNLRMLWLTLNLVTPGYEPGRTQDLYAELAGYTAAHRPFQVRENAFSYLYQLGAFNPESLVSLIKGTGHHTYSFRKYCRELLAELVKNEEYRQKLVEVSEDMPEAETTYLRSQLNG